jgi:glycosyltransferase involved in cell wall biosynthesis
MPRPPRIAFVTYAMYCGGMEAFLLRLGRFLRQQGCEVEVITTIEPGDWFGRWADLHIPAKHVGGAQSSGFLVPPVHSLRVARKLRQGNYDLVFLNHARHAQASLARLPDQVIAIPILHNDADEIYDVGCGNPGAWNVAIGVSPKVAMTARQRVPHRPVIEVSYGVDIPNHTLWEQRSVLRGRIELMFIGRLEHAQKGVLWLSDIYKSCLDRGIDAGLTIVGDGPDLAGLQQRLLEHGLRERTRHLRGLTPEGIYQLLGAAHVLLMPSRFEGLPIALLESQACGCVPVVSRLPGITDAAVEDGKTGMLVAVDDVAGFADAVAGLYHDPARWSRMSSAAHERICQKFSVEAMGASYLQLIHDAMNDRYPLPRSRRYQRPVDLGLFSWRDYLPGRLLRLGHRGRAWLANLSGDGRAPAGQ